MQTASLILNAILLTMPYPKVTANPAPTIVAAFNMKIRGVYIFAEMSPEPVQLLAMAPHNACLRLCATNAIRRLSRQRERSPICAAGSAARRSVWMRTSSSGSQSLPACSRAMSR